MNYLIQHSFYFLLLTQSAICVKEKCTVCSLGTLEAPTGLHYEFKIKARWRVDLRHVAPSRFVHDKTHIAHSNSTNTQFNLYFLLFIPSYLKQVTSFRVMTSIFEALTIRSVRECQKRNKGFLQIWYLYVLSTIQLLQVGWGGWSKVNRSTHSNQQLCAGGELLPEPPHLLLCGLLLQNCSQEIFPAWPMSPLSPCWGRGTGGRGQAACGTQTVQWKGGYRKYILMYI